MTSVVIRELSRNDYVDARIMRSVDLPGTNGPEPFFVFRRKSVRHRNHVQCLGVTQKEFNDLIDANLIYQMDDAECTYWLPVKPV